MASSILSPIFSSVSRRPAPSKSLSSFVMIGVYRDAGGRPFRIGLRTHTGVPVRLDEGLLADSEHLGLGESFDVLELEELLVSLGLRVDILGVGLLADHVEHG